MLIPGRAKFAAIDKTILFVAEHQNLLKMLILGDNSFKVLVVEVVEILGDSGKLCWPMALRRIRCVAEASRNSMIFSAAKSPIYRAPTDY